MLVLTAYMGVMSVMPVSAEEAIPQESETVSVQADYASDEVPDTIHALLEFT